MKYNNDDNNLANKIDAPNFYGTLNVYVKRKGFIISVEKNFISLFRRGTIIIHRMSIVDCNNKTWKC